MEYSATDPSRFVPLLVELASYGPIRMNSSFDFLEAFANQYTMYVPNRWLHMYLMDGHILSSVFIPTNR